MYLAAILGFLALASPCTSAATFSTPLPHLSQDTAAPNAAPAGQATEPSQAGAVPQSEPAPPEQTTPAPTAQEPRTTQPAPAAATPAQTPETKKAESAAKKPRKKRRRRKAVAAHPNASPEKKVVRNGGTAEPVVQLAPGMSAEQADSQRENTSQLLTATDTNLKQISSRQLNSSQQDSVSQIRKYIEQAKAAEQAGDVQRAHNLASKALLLSDDLAKH